MISVSRSVGAALEHTKRILFSPFDFGKWFVMGFCAFLAQLGEGFGLRVPTRIPGALEREALSGALPWVQEHLLLVAILVFLGVLGLGAIGLLLAWLGARGEFMLLDGIVRNRGEIAEPWHSYRRQANSLLGFRILVGCVMLVFILVMVVIGALLALPLIHRGEVRELWKPLLLLAAPTGLGSLACMVYLMVLKDFGVPIMYRSGASPFQAMGILRAQLLPGHLGAFVAFYLLKLVLGIGALLLIILAGCLTCCLGFLPYFHSVLTLPVTVFFRCYALDLMAQMDPELDVFSGEARPENGLGGYR